MHLRGECFRHVEGRLTQRVMIDGQPYFIKQHHGVGYREIWKNLFQLRLPILGAKNEWQAIRHLAANQILTPAIYAYGESGCNPASKHSFILLQELAPTISLETLCATWPSTPPSFAFKFLLLKKVAQMARIMHQSGLNHRDFYLCHFLLDQKAPSNEAKLYLIDLHRAQIRKKIPLRWIIKDLAGLYFSSKDIGLTKRDWLRFMKEYHQQPLAQALSTHQLFWKQVQSRGEKLYRDHQT